MTTLNFRDVDQFRKTRLLISAKRMSEFFGVSRMTYYRWVKHGDVQERFDARNREVMTQLISFCREHNWPDADTRKLTQAQRYDKLTALLENNKSFE